MQTLNEGPDRVNAALTSTLIRTILESRRAIRIAMSMMHELMQTGTVTEWADESPSRSRKRSVSLPGVPKLQVHQGTSLAFALKRKSSHRTPLRLVSPFRHDSPLVMPGDTSYAAADEPEEPKRERRDEERREPKPNESDAPR